MKVLAFLLVAICLTGCRTMDKLASIHRHFVDRAEATTVAQVEPAKKVQPTPVLASHPEKQEVVVVYRDEAKGILMVRRIPLQTPAPTM